MPRFAYSIASDLVAAFRPPFVSEASTDGTPAIAWSTRLVVICTTWPLPLLLHLGDGELRDVKEAGDVDAEHRRVIGLGVLGERLGDENAGVVDQRVDAPEPGHASAIARSAVFRSAMSPDTATNSRHRGWLDGARGRDHPVVCDRDTPRQAPRRCPATRR